MHGRKLKGKVKMFSLSEKQHIARELERIILELEHPEMPIERLVFKLHIEGKATWSWADIEPNWIYEIKEPKVNSWNEVARDILGPGK